MHYSRRSNFDLAKILLISPKDNMNVLDLKSGNLLFYEDSKSHYLILSVNILADSRIRLVYYSSISNRIYSPEYTEDTELDNKLILIS